MVKARSQFILGVLRTIFLIGISLASSVGEDGSSPTDKPPVKNFWLSCPHQAAGGRLSVQETLLAGQPFRPAPHRPDLDLYPTEDPSHTYGRRSTTPTPVAYPQAGGTMLSRDRYLYPTTPRADTVHASQPYPEVGVDTVRRSLTADVELLRYTANSNPEVANQPVCGGGETECVYTVSGHVKLNQRIIKERAVINTVRGRGVVDINKRTSVSLCLSSPVNQELLLEITVESLAETDNRQNVYQEAEDQYSRDRYARNAHYVRLARRQTPAQSVSKFDCLVDLPSDVFQDGYRPEWQTPRCSAHPSISGQDNEELLFRYVVYQTDSEACTSDNVQAGDWISLNG